MLEKIKMSSLGKRHPPAMALHFAHVMMKITLTIGFFMIAAQALRLLAEPITARRRGRVARPVAASELLSRGALRRRGSIPKIFHQSWKTVKLPAKFEAWSLSCRQKHKDWEWVVWTDEDNLHLVQQYFPWLEETYRGLPSVIYQADLARFLYMYIYGGVYADLDTECLRPTEHLEATYGPLFDQVQPLAPDTAIFGRMGNDPGFAHSIPNAWMASTPGHPFFLAAIQHVMELYNRTQEGNKVFDLPESVTGPVSLRDAIAEYEKNKVLNGPHVSPVVNDLIHVGPFAHDPSEHHQVLLLPSHMIYPYSWGGDGQGARDVCWVLQDTYDANQCKRRLDVHQKGSISITYWSHTHSPSGHSEENMAHILHLDGKNGDGDSQNGGKKSHENGSVIELAKP